MTASIAGLLAAGLAGLTSVAVTTAVAGARRTVVRRRLRPAAAGGPERAVSLPPPVWFVRRLRATGVPWPPGAVWTACVAAAAGAAVVGVVVGGPPLGLVGVGAVAGGVLLALTLFRDRADRLVEAALPDALEAMSRALRSGASLVQAVAEAAAACPPALADDLAATADEAAHGRGLVAALATWEQRRSLPGVRLATAALSLAAETGGAQAQAVDGVAATIRSRLAVEAEVRALSSQARSSAVVIGLAPLGFAVVAAGADDSTADFLLRTPAGLACLTTGLALDALAAWWMTRLTRVDP